MYIYIHIILVFEKLLLGCSGSFLPTFLESSPSTFFDARPLYLSEGTENCFHLPLIIFLWRKGTWNEMQVEVHSWEQGWNLLTPQRFPSQKQISPTRNNVAEFMRWNKSWFYACCAEKTLVSWLSSHDREVLPLTDEGGLIPQRLLWQGMQMHPNKTHSHAAKQQIEPLEPKKHLDPSNG